MKRIDRYIAWQWFKWFCGLSLIFALAIAAIDFVEQSRTVGARVDLSPAQLGWLTCLKLPMLLAEALPFIVLVTSLFTYARLGRRKELPVIQTSGYSSFSVLLPSLVMSGLVGAVHLGVLNPAGARTTAAFEQHRAEFLALMSTGEENRSTVWFKEVTGAGTRLVSGTPLPGQPNTFSNITLFELNSGGNAGFVRRLMAEQGVWAWGSWQLSGVTEQVADAPPNVIGSLVLNSDFDPSSVLAQTITRKTVGFADLPRFIETRQAAGLPTDKFRMRFAELAASPLLYFAMALIGGLACLRLDRLGQTALRISVSVLAAIALYLSVQLGISLGAAGQIPVSLAAFGPPLAASFIGLLLVTANQH